MSEFAHVAGNEIVPTDKQAAVFGVLRESVAVVPVEESSEKAGKEEDIYLDGEQLVIPRYRDPRNLKLTVEGL